VGLCNYSLEELCLTSGLGRVLIPEHDNWVPKKSLEGGCRGWMRLCASVKRLWLARWPLCVDTSTWHRQVGSGAQQLQMWLHAVCSVGASCMSHGTIGQASRGERKRQPLFTTQRQCADTVNPERVYLLDTSRDALAAGTSNGWVERGQEIAPSLISRAHRRRVQAKLCSPTRRRREDRSP
jgi:hypothetical protein